MAEHHILLIMAVALGALGLGIGLVLVLRPQALTKETGRREG